MFCELKISKSKTIANIVNKMNWCLPVDVIQHVLCILCFSSNGSVEIKKITSLRLKLTTTYRSDLDWLLMISYMPACKQVICMNQKIMFFRMVKFVLPFVKKWSRNCHISAVLVIAVTRVLVLENFDCGFLALVPTTDLGLCFTKDSKICKYSK